MLKIDFFKKNNTYLSNMYRFHFFYPPCILLTRIVESWEPLTRVERSRGGPVQVMEETSLRSYLLRAYKWTWAPFFNLSPSRAFKTTFPSEDIEKKKPPERVKKWINETSKKRRYSERDDADRYSLRCQAGDQDRDVDWCHLSQNFTRM